MAIRRAYSTQDYTTDDANADLYTDPAAPPAATTDAVDRLPGPAAPDVMPAITTNSVNPTPTAATTPTTTTAARTNYNPIAGWEVSKLNDPGVSDTKYNFGRAAEDYTGGYGRGNL